MISSYRLGDLVLLGFNDDETNTLLLEYPNSVGSKYILEKRNNPDINNIDTITKIVLEYMDNTILNLPNDISESTVIHLRLCDVVSGNNWHKLEHIHIPFPVDYIKSQLINYSNKKYVIGKSFFVVPSPTNCEECINLSNQYLQTVISELQATHFNSLNADIDLCCAINSKLFIQGKGGYSQLIVDIRTKLNRNNILYII